MGKGKESGERAAMDTEKMRKCGRERGCGCGCGREHGA